MLRPIIFHPFIFALFPPIFLYLQNTGKLNFREVAPTLLAASGALILVWFLTSRLTPSRHKSAAITSLFFLMFFSFGHIVTVLEVLLSEVFKIDHLASARLESQHSMAALLVIWIVILAVVALLILKSASNFVLTSKFFNIMSIAITLMNVYVYYHFVAYVNNSRKEIAGLDIQQSLNTGVSLSSPSIPLPDIYYIILDGYARSDILREIYQEDNSDFISFLKQKGFYIADQSHTNYGMTVLSLSSSLNMMYLNDLARKMNSDSQNQLLVIRLIQNNQVLKMVKSLGYTTTTYATDYPATELYNTDRFYSPSSRLSGFQSELINSTALVVFLYKTQYDIHRNTIRYTFDQLSRNAGRQSPTFTFAHIVAPHPPFVFNRNGSAIYPERRYVLDDGSHLMDLIDRNEYIEKYKNQLEFTDSIIEKTINDILAASHTPPIIVIQSDHGPGSKLDWESIENTDLDERMSILNAYYFPDQNYSALYPGITPVNTFRIIMNQYFGANYKLLGDRSYFSKMSRPYAFYDVTEKFATH